MNEEQKQKYAQLSPAQQRLIDPLPEDQKGSAVDFAWAVANADQLANPNTTTQTQTSSGTTPIGGGNAVWQPGVTSSTNTVADLSTSSAQGAIGVTGQRRVQIVKLPSGQFRQQVVPGSYTGYDPTVVTPYGTLQKTPRYFEGDEDQIATFRPEEIATIQKRMQKAGLLGSKYRIGIADDVTVSKFKEVLAQANRTGSNWDAALSTLQASQQVGGLTYKVSNPEDIRAVVQQTAAKVLGRSADDQLVNRIVKSYQQLQVEEQQGMTVGGMRTGAPDVGVFAETQLREGTGGDAEAFRFAQFASRVLGS